MAQEASHNAALLLCFAAKRKRGKQIQNDAVIVAGIQRDIASGFGDRANNIQGLIPIERGNFYRQDVFDPGESPPKGIGEQSSANRGLKIKADQREHASNFSAMGEQSFIIPVGYGAKTEQSGMVFEIAQKRRFSNGLTRFAAHAADAHERDCALYVSAVHFFGSELQDRFEQTDLRLPNRKLSCVYSYGQAAGTGRRVVPSKSALSALVQASRWGKSKGMRGDYGPPFYDLMGAWIHVPLVFVPVVGAAVKNAPLVLRNESA